MDSLITAAARALAAGNPLGALTRVALRDDPPALALRGIAMAQLGDLVRARALLRKAVRAYGPREALSRARCRVAEAEIALACRELNWSSTSLIAARTVLEMHGDHSNAAHARYLEIRRFLLIGRLDDAESLLDAIESDTLPPALRVAHELSLAGIAMRRMQAAKARAALERAAGAARQSGITALAAEVDNASQALAAPIARLIAFGAERPLGLDEVEALLSSQSLIVDAHRFRIRDARCAIDLAGRPMLFTLARLLGEAWPKDVPREVLVARLFRAKRADESHRARLRVEAGRLRRMIRAVADVVATRRGFALLPRGARDIAVLARLVEDEHAAVLAVMADGEAWSSSTLALALHVSARTAQRALESLAANGKVQAFGRGRARRWTTPAPSGFTTPLLLSTPLPGD